jgi:hypothetical protein
VAVLWTFCDARRLVPVTQQDNKELTGYTFRGRVLALARDGALFAAMVMRYKAQYFIVTNLCCGLRHELLTDRAFWQLMHDTVILQLWIMQQLIHMLMHMRMRIQTVYLTMSVCTSSLWGELGSGRFL